MYIERPASKQPMPDSAKLVFKGILFDVYHWRQEMFDGTKRTFEKLKRLDASVIIPVTQDGSILITEQRQPGRQQYTALPGGHHDAGEDPLTAAKRELLEETGYTSNIWELYDSLQPTSKADWAIYYFVARNCVPVQAVEEDGGERIILRKVSFEEFLQYCRRPDFAERELKVHVLEALLDPAIMAVFKKKILG